MANRNDLRSSLRAADKRRQRRVDAFAASSSPGVPKDASDTNAGSVDAVNAIVQAAVVYCQGEGCRFDAVLVNGLRGYIKQSSPQREQARGFYELLGRLADELVQKHPGFAPRQFRNAVQDLLEMAKDYDAKNPHDTRFLDFLELLSRG